MKKPIAAIVLAAMIAPAYADDGRQAADPWWRLEILEIGVWPSGVWPNINTMALYDETGGVIKEHIERWQELARSGADVEILGACYSACTLIVSYVPKERLCFGAFATLQFHLAWNRETGKPSLDASLWMLKQYPREIYDWIMERGGVVSMTIPTFWELRAPNLWRMGYRQCERDR